MAKRIWHGFLALVGVFAIPGVVAGAWYGVVDLGWGIFLFLFACLGILVNFLASRAGPDIEEDKPPLYVILIVGWFFICVVAIPAGNAIFVWYELNSPFAYQYNKDYEIARHIDPDGRFALDYPADWQVLTPAEARIEMGDRMTIPNTAVLFIGTAPTWLENINIQMSPATYNKGELVGDDEDELQDAGPMLRKELQKAFPFGSVGSFSVYEEDDRNYLELSLWRNDDGIRVKQTMKTTVLNKQLVTFTSTAPIQSASGLQRYRFATIIRSFESPAGEKQ